MAEAVEKFEILVRHGAICSRLEIDSLVEAYKEMKPALHRHCDTDDVVDVEALLYATDRLPSSIYQVKEILIQADAPDKLPSMAGVIRLDTGARRRPTFQLGSDTIIVVAREGRTELLDLITLLCSYQIEALKISKLLHGTELSKCLSRVLLDENHSLEERNQLLARLAFELGTTDDLIVDLDKEWSGELLERLQFLATNPPNFVARLHRDYSVEASHSRAKKWARALKRCIESLVCGDGPVHIVSSNTHSTVNLLAGYALSVSDEIWDWALENSPHRDSLQSLENRTENVTYFLLRDWLKAHPERKEEKNVWDRQMGVVHLEDEYYTGIHSQVLELSKIEANKADPRLTRTLEELTDTRSVILNFDYAFGEQAGILIEQLFKELGHRIRSFSIMGKAGTVVGERGGIMLPTYLLKEGSRDVYDLPFGNALLPQDLEELGLSNIHSGGPMLTVAGTILQNETMLRKYREDWNILGLEMEGIPYIRALHQCLKRGFVSDQLSVLVGYYASDAPLEVGESLARQLAFDGLDPTYGLNVAILKRLLNSSPQFQTVEEPSLKIEAPGQNS